MARRYGNRKPRAVRVAEPTYAKVTTEHINVVRLFQTDYASNLATGLVGRIRAATGINNRPFDFRLLAVGFQTGTQYFSNPVSGGGTAGISRTATTLEFMSSGNTYTLVDELKPARVKVSKSDYVTSQWFHYDPSATPSVTSSLNGTNAENLSLFSLGFNDNGFAQGAEYSPLQFIDVAVRY